MARNEDIERIIAERERSRPSIGAHDPRFRPLDEQRTTAPAWIASKMPTGAARDLVRVATHGLGQTGTTLMRFLDIPNRVFGNTRSRLQDIYEAAERNMARDGFEDKSGAAQVGATAVHLASMGVAGRALPAVFGANVGADTYETAKYAGASEGEALAKGVGHGVVDTAIWTLGQGLASKYLPKAWQWLGRVITGAGRGAASSVTSDAVLNSLGADISGEEMAKRAVHAAWMVPLLGMLKIGGGKRREAMELLKKARPDLAGERAERVIEVLENEFSDRNSQVTALQWVARKGANLPDDVASIKGAIEAYGRAQDTVKAIPHMRKELEGLAAEPPKADPKDEAKRQARIKRLTQNLEAAEKLNEDFASGPSLMKRSPFEIISNENYARFLPRPNPRDVKAFSNMKRYPMGVIGFDVSDDAAGRQATREMINAYMSPSSNPWCLATGKDAARLGELGPGAEGYWKQHSAVPKQIFFQEVDGKLELTAFRATSPGGEGQQEYWDTSDAGYSGIPIKVKVPGDPMGRYRKMVFRPSEDGKADIRGRDGELLGRGTIEDMREFLRDHPEDEQTPPRTRTQLQALRDTIKQNEATDVLGTFEDIAPGKVFKGDPFRDGRSQTWARPSKLAAEKEDTAFIDNVSIETLNALQEEGFSQDANGLRSLIELERRLGNVDGAQRASQELQAIENDAPVKASMANDGYVLVEDKVRTTENGITRFRTTKYADPTNRDYEPPKPGEQPKPVEIEESELVSPEWMRTRGYDPESESDVRRMQRDLNIQDWGNGVEAAMAVVPTKRTYLQTKSGAPETVTYWPNGRAIMAVDFVKDGVPYKEEYDYAGPNWDMESPDHLYPGDTFYQLPRPEYGEPLTANAVNRRLIRNPGTEMAEVLDDVRVDEGLEGFVRTSGNRRWRTAGLLGADGISDPETRRRVQAVEAGLATRLARFNSTNPPDLGPVSSMGPIIVDGREVLSAQRAANAVAWTRTHRSFSENEVFPLYYGLQTEAPHWLPPREGWPSASDIAMATESPRIIVEDRQPDGTWAPAVDHVVNAETGEVVELPPPPPAVRTADTRMITDDGIEAARNLAYDEMEESYIRHLQGLPELPVPQRPRASREADAPLPPEPEPLTDDNVPFALKAGRTRRNVRAAEGGGDTPGVSETAVSETPVSEAPQEGGPRIVINPQVFNDKRDALCVAFNEAFRVVMEMNGFEPVSEPTEKQRKFFAETAYANDELQLRRTILARIATLDTSVSDPTDEQLEETMEMLEMVMEVGAPQNEWEQQAVQRLHDVVAKSLESTRANGTARQPEPPKEEASTQADVGGGITDEEWKDGDVRYVEKDGSYYRQTYKQGETSASSGWQGAAIGKDEWDSAQRNIEKGVSAQRFAEAWDAGTEDWNNQQKEIRGLMDTNTEAHNEVNRMATEGVITPERAQRVHNFDASDGASGGWTWKDDTTGRFFTFGAGTIRDIYGETDKGKNVVGYHASGDRGVLNQTRTLDLDLNEDELAKKATSSALAGLANMEPDKPAEPQAAGLAGTEPEKAPEATPVPSGAGMAGIPSGTGEKPPETAVAGAPGTSSPNWANGAVAGKNDASKFGEPEKPDAEGTSSPNWANGAVVGKNNPEAFGRVEHGWANGQDVSEFRDDPGAFGTEAPGIRGVAMPKPVEPPKLNWQGLASRTDARGRYFDSDGRVITKRQAERMERKKRKELGLA